MFRAILAFCEFFIRRSGKEGSDLASFLHYSYLRPSANATLGASGTATLISGVRQKLRTAAIPLAPVAESACGEKHSEDTWGYPPTNGFCAPGGDYNNSTPNELCNFFEKTASVSLYVQFVDARKESSKGFEKSRLGLRFIFGDFFEDFSEYFHVS